MRLFKLFIRCLIKYYFLFLIAGIGLAALSIPRVIYLFKNISTDPVDLLPEDFLSVKTLLKIREKVEAQELFGVVFESDRPENTKRLLHDLKPLLESKPVVGKVYLTKPGWEFFDRQKFLFMDLEDLYTIRDRLDRKIQREKLGDLYISFEDEDGENLDFRDLEDKYRGKYGGETTSEYYVSPNGKVFALYAESKHTNLDLEEEREFQEAVQEVVEKFDYRSYDSTMKLYFGGSARVMEYRAMLRDLKIAGIISGLAIFLPLLVRFRRPQYVLVIFFPLLIGIPLGLALASQWVPHLNITTSFLFAILGGLGVETGIHLFARFHRNRRAGRDLEEALFDTYRNLSRPILTAVASLALTFLLMIVNDFRGFSEFGFITGIGLWTIFLLYFTFFPALLVFCEKIKIFKFKEEIGEIHGRLNLSPDFVVIVLLIFSLFTAYSVWAAPRIKFEYNTKKIRADEPRTRLAKLKQRLTVGNRKNNPAIVLIQNEEESEALRQALSEKRDKNPKSMIYHFSSIYSLVPKQQPEKLGVLKEIQNLLADDSIKLVKGEKKEDLEKFKTELKKPRSFTLEDVPNEIKEVFLGRLDIFGSLLLIYTKPHLELDNGKNAIAFAKEVKEIQTPLGTFHASSSAIVFSDVIVTMFRDSKTVLLIAAASVFLFVYLDFRNLKKSALVMFSIITGVVWVMGVLYLLRIKMNLYNLVMIPAIMGMSVDNSIHIFHRYRELGKGSLSEVLGTTGISVILASLTNAAGFLGLAFCTHGGLRSMGIVAMTGVLTCLITTLVFLPMILQFLEWRGSIRIRPFYFHRSKPGVPDASEPQKLEPPSPNHDPYESCLPPDRGG